MDAYDRARAIVERERRRRRRGLPTAGKSERIMRNRILRAQSFGLTCGDNRYAYGGNR